MLSNVFAVLSDFIEIPIPHFYEDFEDVSDMDLYNDPLQLMGKVMIMADQNCNIIQFLFDTSE